MPGRRAASIDLPLPGGPTISRWWRPAAAISSARLAFSWPFTSAKSRAEAASGDRAGLGRGEGGAAGEVVDERASRVFGGDHLDRADPGGLGAAAGRADQAAVGLGRGQRGGQGADHRDQRAVERELAEGHRAGDLVVREDLHRGEQRERDGQVEVRAFLGQVGGREVDGDALGRQREAHGGHRGADAFLGLGDRLVGQADEVEGGQAGGDGALHLDEPRLDPLEGDRVGARGHCGVSRVGRLVKLSAFRAKPFVSPLRVKDAQRLGRASGGDICGQMKGRRVCPRLVSVFAALLHSAHRFTLVNG